MPTHTRLTRWLHRWPPALLLALLIWSSAMPVAALERRSGEIIILEAGQTINDDLALAGETVTVAGHVTGDLFAAGNSVTILPEARIDGDVFVAGNNIVISGTVGDSVRAAGNLIQISGAIDRNVLGFGNQITLDTSGRVGGNWLSSAETVLIQGQVVGSVTNGGEYLQLGGSVGRDMELWVKRLALQPDARVAGDLIYTAPVEQPVPPRLIQGAIEHRPPAPPAPPRPPERDFSIFGAFLSLLWLGGLLVVGMLIAWLVPGLYRRAQAILEERALLAFGIGLLALIATPILAILLFVTIIGIPLGLLSLGAFAGSLYIGWILAATALAGLLVGMMRRTGRSVAVIWLVLLGLIGLHALTQFPILGGLLAFVVICLGLGLVVLLISDWLRQRPARQAPEGPRLPAPTLPA